MNAHAYCPTYGLEHAFWGYLFWEPFSLSEKVEKLQFLPTDCYIIHFLLKGTIQNGNRGLQSGDAWVQPPATALQMSSYAEESQIFSVYLRSSCYHPDLLQSKALRIKLSLICQNLIHIYSNATFDLDSHFPVAFYDVLRGLYEMISPKGSPAWLAQVTTPLSTENLGENPQKDLPLCERHFRRKFKQIMGLAPSVYFRLQRFHHALRLRKEKPYLDLIDLISLCRFYDHSHFTREFKYFSGQSPTKFFQQSDDYRELMIPSLMFDSMSEVS